MAFNRIKRTFQYEPEVPDDYTEHGVEKGAKVEDGKIDSPDMVRIVSETRGMTLDEVFVWLNDHRREFKPLPYIVDTDSGDDVAKMKSIRPQFIVQKRSLNLIRHLNTLLNRANETLEDGGYLWCHTRTASLKRRQMMERYPWGINYLMFTLHFLWHRVIPKMNMTKSLYFWVTKGRNRTFNRVEVLGRMYRAGFEVVDEEFRHGEFFVLAKKVKTPIWDDVPSGSLLIKLKRIGKDGKYIGVYKFRTMYSYSEYLQPYIYEHNHLQKGGKFADDYRVTPWGRWMRKLWIDELPMIYNVIKGDLKLVGVRPLSRHYFSLYKPEIQKMRIKVKPGLLPPGIAEKKRLITLDEIQASEKKYTEMYLRKPIKTDFEYFIHIIINIFLKGRRGA